MNKEKNIVVTWHQSAGSPGLQIDIILKKNPEISESDFIEDAPKM